MSTLYGGNDNFPDTLAVLDDGDDASANGIGAPALEGLADRTVWLREQMKRGVWVPCGAVPYVSFASRFSTDFNYLNVFTATAAGDEYRAALRLQHGERLEAIDVIFVPKTTARGGWPLGTAPTVKLLRAPLVAGATPAAPSLVVTETYIPVSQANYQDGNFKLLTCEPTGHVVDAEGYAYFLSIIDEDGANAIPGGSYVAFRVTYQS